MGARDSFQISSLIMNFEMNNTLPLSKIIAKLLFEVFPDAKILSAFTWSRHWLDSFLSNPNSSCSSYPHA